LRLAPESFYEQQDNGKQTDNGSVPIWFVLTFVALLLFPPLNKM
jgi:hypothetical protein